MSNTIDRKYLLHEVAAAIKVLRNLIRRQLPAKSPERGVLLDKFQALYNTLEGILDDEVPSDYFSKLHNTLMDDPEAAREWSLQFLWTENKEHILQEVEILHMTIMDMLKETKTEFGKGSAEYLEAEDRLYNAEMPVMLITDRVREQKGVTVPSSLVNEMSDAYHQALKAMGDVRIALHQWRIKGKHKRKYAAINSKYKKEIEPYSMLDAEEEKEDERRRKSAKLGDLPKSTVQRQYRNDFKLDDSSNPDVLLNPYYNYSNGDLYDVLRLQLEALNFDEAKTTVKFIDTYTITKREATDKNAKKKKKKSERQAIGKMETRVEPYTEDRLDSQFESAVKQVKPRGSKRGKTRILMPIHKLTEGGSQHWAAMMLASDDGGKTVYVYYNDSFSSKSKSKVSEKLPEDLENSLLRVAERLRTTLSIFDFRRRQQSGSDCGAYTIENLMTFFQATVEMGAKVKEETMRELMEDMDDSSSTRGNTLRQQHSSVIATQQAIEQINTEQRNQKEDLSSYIQNEMSSIE